MNKPKISVILPYYNAADTLFAAANSILQQTFPHFELILVNNASTDNSQNIAQNLAFLDKRIISLYEVNKGVSHAFNKGLAVAKGNFIARMDADDLSHPKRLQKQFDFLVKNPSVAVVATQVLMPYTQQNLGFKRFVDWSNQLTTNKEIFLKRFVEQPVVNPSILCRKAVFTHCGSYQHGDFPEDYDWFLRIMEKGFTIGKIPEKLLTWQDSLKRLSRTDIRYSTEAFYRCKAKYLAHWLKKHCPKNLQIAVWGTGKKSLQRVALLTHHRITVSTYIDMFPTTNKKIDYLYYEHIPAPGKYFIISYVGNWGARDEIKKYLETKEYKEGIDFLMAA